MTQFVSIFLLLLAVCRQETYEVTGFSVHVASDVQRVKTAFVKPTNHPARFQRKACDVPNRSFPRAKINTRVGLWSAASDTGDVAEAEDLASIQTLFSKYCDKDGLMSKETLEQMPPFSEMMAEGDLLPEELTDIWRTAPKFPDGKTRIDVDSFVQIYRDVDDLFEEEEEEGSPTEDVTATISDDDETDKNEDTMEAELETVFITICDKDSLIAKDNLKKWDEIQKLLSEGLLGEDEFDQIWEETPKSPGSNRLDVDGFLSFNVALDGLFEFDDDDLDEDIVQNEIEEDTQPVSSAPKAMKMVDGDDLPPGVLFAALADDEYMVGMDELKCWRELQEWLEDGDLLPLELQTIYERHVSSGSEKLNEDSFVKLYNDIDSLFEEVEDDDQQKEDIMSQNEQNQRSAAKEDLIDLISIIDEESENLPCGLDATERDQKQILNIVSALEEDPTNLIRQKSGTIEMEDVSGTWELMYSSSSAMKFNKGLSGLGGSFPNGKFAGLKQRLQASKYMTDLEYIERIEVTPSTASFDVRVDGGWELRTSVSLFTGQPSTVLYVEPDKVTYGPTSTRADHWKSLGSMNMLDLTYLDDDIRVMRGCTSADTLFIFQRVED